MDSLGVVNNVDAESGVGRVSGLYVCVTRGVDVAYM